MTAIAELTARAPWARAPQDVTAELGTDPASGLDPEEAGRRLLEHGPNLVPAGRRTSWWRSLADQLRQTMILVLLAAAGISVVVGDGADTVVILLVIGVNVAVGAAQERSALRALASLDALSAPAVRVRRGGTARTVATAELVPGDLLVLAGGDVVGADARLLTADDLLVDESALTGESLPVGRDVDAVSPDTPLADRRCMVHGGTLVLHGSATAVVVATGPDSQVGTISTLLARTTPPQTPLQRRVARLGRQISAAVVAACLLVGVIGLIGGRPWDLVLLSALSLAVAAIPESLPAVVTLSLATGARRMVRRGAIVRSLPSVETLGSVTVLATDKTGTLTTGRMTTVLGWTPGAGEQAPGPRLKDLLEAACLCSDAVPGESGGGMTEAALVEGAAATGVDVLALRNRYPRTSTVPFDHLRRDMRTSHVGPDGPFSLVKGAPESVLGDADEDARRIAATWAGAGRRVLAVARDGRVVGLVALADPVRPEAPAAIAACRSAGLTPVLITGDHPGTAGAIAEQTGITRPGEPDEAPGIGARVHARAEPRQKLELVQSWQAQGHVVAMTGDGVNDAPALRAADIGVAMGRRGTDVAREAADLVLTDDSLATVVAAVSEGRRVFDNIRRFLRYGLTGGAAEVAVMLLGPLLGFAIPLLPAQILWVNLLTHGLPGVAIGTEAAEPDVMRRRPRSPREQLLDRGTVGQIALLGATLTAAALVAAVWARATGRPDRTVLFATLALGQLGLALATRSDRVPIWRVPPWTNPPLWPAVGLSAVLVAAGIYLPVLQHLLGTAPLDGTTLAVVALLAAAPAAVAQGLVVARGTRVRRAAPRFVDPERKETS